MELLITSRNVAFLLISSMVLGLLYLIELLVLLTDLGRLKLYHLIYPRILTEFGMLVFFTILSLTEFQVKYFVLFLFFSVKGGFRWFWMGNPDKNIQLMLGVPCSKPLGGSKVNSAFHPSEVDKMSTRNIWELSGKK